MSKNAAMHGPRLGSVTKCIRVIGIAYASSAVLGCSSNSDAALPVQPSERVWDFVEALPLNPWAYITLALAFVAIWGGHAYRRRTAARTDWDVVDTLRARGSALRARADSLLLSAVVLLVAGTYFMIWVIPRIENSDYLFKFEDRLQAWGSGKYWARTHYFEEDLLPLGMSNLTEQGHQDVLSFTNGATLEALDGGRRWRERQAVTNAGDVGPPNGAACNGVAIFADDGKHRACSVLELRGCMVGLAENGETIELPIELPAEEREQFRLTRYDTRREVTAFEFSPNLEHGLIGTRDGAIHLTADGGKTWERRQEVAPSDREWVVGAVVGDEGPLLVVGDEGSVRVLDGTTWKALPHLGESGRMTALAFHPDLEHGLIGTRDGAIHLMADGGKTWKRQTRQEVGLNDREWVVGAVIGKGPLLVVGDEGSVRVLDGKTWKELRRPSGSGRLTAFEFHLDLEHGLIGTRDGAIHLTADGGKIWESRTRQELGLNDRQWVVGAVVGDKGPLLVVSDKGTIHTLDGKSSRTPCDDANGGQWRYMPGSTSAFARLWSKTRVITTTAVGEQSSKPLRGPADELLEVDEFIVREKPWFRTSEGRVWTIKDGNWKEEELFPWVEEAAAIALGNDGEIVGVGNEGSLAIGEMKSVMKGEFNAEESGVVAAATLQGGHVVVLDDGGTLYLRREPAKDVTLSALYRSLPQESLLAVEIASERGYSLRRLPASEKSLIEILGIDEQYWMRIAVLFATIYIAQLLVRLHQYALRLAAFWDSRADAVMLSSTFSKKKLSFDSLVAALAPDTLDLKPPKWRIFASRTGHGGAKADQQGT